MPGLPAEIAEQMRQLWHAAVSVQLDDVVQLKAEARQSVEAAQAVLAESNLHVDMLREEPDALRGQLAARGIELAGANAQLASLRESQTALQAELRAARARAAALEQSHAASLAAVPQRYEGLSKQLLQETAQQRQALQQEQSRLSSQKAAGSAWRLPSTHRIRRMSWSA